MKTTKTNFSMTANLDAVRAQAKAHSTALAAAAVPTPAPTWPVGAPQRKPQLRAVRARPNKPAKPVTLQQFNVRLTPTAKARLQAAAKACQVSEQAFLEAWAMSLPEPVAYPPDGYQGRSADPALAERTGRRVRRRTSRPVPGPSRRHAILFFLGAESRDRAAHKPQPNFPPRLAKRYLKLADDGRVQGFRA